MFSQTQPLAADLDKVMYSFQPSKSHLQRSNEDDYRVTNEIPMDTEVWRFAPSGQSSTRAATMDATNPEILEAPRGNFTGPSYVSPTDMEYFLNHGPLNPNDIGIPNPNSYLAENDPWNPENLRCHEITFPMPDTANVDQSMWTVSEQENANTPIYPDHNMEDYPVNVGSAGNIPTDDPLSQWSIVNFQSRTNTRQTQVLSTQQNPATTPAGYW